YLLGSFSYADIALATALGMKHAIGPAQPALREVWAFPELEREFPDLVLWQQRLLAETNPRLASHLRPAA
ncbi:MAG TPA: hypothetical protein VFX59_01955, partial [Polyangiales bacterium]|nr:hypothetical protein [Polyangiales bacterium]